MPSSKIVTAVTIQKQTSPTVQRAVSIVITPKTITEATDLLTELNQALKRATAEKERVTKPINEALKAERSRWKPFETLVEDAIDSLRSKLTRYQTELTEKRKAEEEAIASRVGPGKGKLSANTAIERINSLETVDTQIKGETGALSFRAEKKFEVMDIVALVEATKDKYITANETAIRVAMKAGVELPGVRYYTEQVPINR